MSGVKPKQKWVVLSKAVWNILGQHMFKYKIEQFFGTGDFYGKFYCIRTGDSIEDKAYLQKNGTWLAICGPNGFFSSREEIESLLE